MDELLPVSRGSGEWFNLGLTLVDSLDTLALMGLAEEHAAAREWVRASLVLDQVGRAVGVWGLCFEGLRPGG